MTPEDRRYSREHCWVKPEEGRDTVRVGITRYGADALRELVFIELPRVGTVLLCGSRCATIESSKAMFEVASPLGGRVAAVNAKLDRSPQVVSRDPYGEGWMVEIVPAERGELDGLMTAGEYEAYLEAQ